MITTPELTMFSVLSMPVALSKNFDYNRKFSLLCGLQFFRFYVVRICFYIDNRGNTFELNVHKRLVFVSYRVIIISFDGLSIESNLHYTLDMFRMII